MANLKVSGVVTELEATEFDSMYGTQHRAKFVLKADAKDEYGVLCEGSTDLVESLTEGKEHALIARPFAVAGSKGKPWVKLIVQKVIG